MADKRTEGRTEGGTRVISYDAVRLTSLKILTKIEIEDYAAKVGITENEVKKDLNKIAY